MFLLYSRSPTAYDNSWDARNGVSPNKANLILMVEPSLDKLRDREIPLFSYGFRPFFLGAALFAGLAIPVWFLILAGDIDLAFHFASRDWHVHEMVFGFLPAVITGFLLTAIPNWTDRPPLKGFPLMLLFMLWLGGRSALAIPWFPPTIAAVVDSAFLIVVAGIVWKEIVAGAAWDRSPMGVLISLYAVANILFHLLAANNAETDIASRMALALIMILLALIGGRITPGFTQDFFEETGNTKQPAPFSPVDGISIVLVAVAAMAWVAQPRHVVTGWILVAAGLANLARLIRWYGWVTWREPLVLILHIGYGWLSLSLLILGGSILGLGPPIEDAVHALTTGAVGVMTLAVMTRATLGHTGRPKHAGFLTVLIYVLVNLGVILRVTGPMINIPTTLMLGLAAVAWSGAYILFTMVYGPMLLGPSLNDD